METIDDHLKKAYVVQSYLMKIFFIQHDESRLSITGVTMAMIKHVAWSSALDQDLMDAISWWFICM